jgi:uncharacterized protein YeaO (DUF488 family)
MTTRTPDRVRIKRAYAAPAPDDGRRVLVDRMWPRGVKRDDLELDDWLKEVAPSDSLRRWFRHDPDRWPEFITRYRDELTRPPASAAMAELVRHARHGRLTLVYAASDETHNNAVMLRDTLMHHLSHRTSGRRGG